MFEITFPILFILSCPFLSHDNPMPIEPMPTTNIGDFTHFSATSCHATTIHLNPRTQATKPCQDLAIKWPKLIEIRINLVSMCKLRLPNFDEY